MVNFRSASIALVGALIAILPPQASPNAAGDYVDEAWTVLTAGLHEKSSDRRAEAISTLDLLSDDPRALREAEKALDDPDTTVRVAAVDALGDMNARTALPKIKSLVRDADGKLIVAIAGVLKKFDDPEG
jgi:HEAT repeat protein